MQFIDEAKIYLKAGNGGNGCVSFRREKFIDMGGPDGGNGGRGGSVIFETNSHINTLLSFRYKQHFKASNGEGGKGSNRSGKSANDLVIPVPIGTQVFTEEGLLLYDFLKDNETFEILAGGKGGVGNYHFRSSKNQAPRRFTKGEPGEELNVELKLKVLSDAGLIGLPNAGKSTFLSKVSNAKPKIADYPFTTLAPMLGIVYIHDEEFVLADIPGLIEGAHKGSGLGDRFLKHIERCRVLVHLIDVNSDDIKRDYLTIRNELVSYSPALVEKNEIILLNKCDLITDKELESKIASLKNITNSKIFTISAYTNLNVKLAKEQIFDVINANRG